MFNEMKKDYGSAVTGHNQLMNINEALRHAQDDMKEKFKMLEDRYKVLKIISKNRTQGTPELMQSVETDQSIKTIMTKKFPDPPVFIDGKEPIIDEWLSAMRNKMEANED